MVSNKDFAISNFTEVVGSLYKIRLFDKAKFKYKDFINNFFSKYQEQFLSVCFYHVTYAFRVNLLSIDQLPKRLTVCIRGECMFESFRRSF